MVHLKKLTNLRLVDFAGNRSSGLSERELLDAVAEYRKELGENAKTVAETHGREALQAGIVEVRQLDDVARLPAGTKSVRIAILGRHPDATALLEALSKVEGLTHVEIRRLNSFTPDQLSRLGAAGSLEALTIHDTDLPAIGRRRWRAIANLPLKALVVDSEGMSDVPQAAANQLQKLVSLVHSDFALTKTGGGQEPDPSAMTPSRLLGYISVVRCGGESYFGGPAEQEDEAREILADSLTALERGDNVQAQALVKEAQNLLGMAKRSREHEERRRQDPPKPAE